LTFQTVIERVSPTDDEPSTNSHFFKNLQMNPHDTWDNLPPDYLNNLENLSKEEYERFLYGNFRTSQENAIYEDQLKATQRTAEIVICRIRSLIFHYPLTTRYFLD
jgi:hypothetical protein